ncbi:MAG: hypothetical protein ACJASQ_001218 [Crocinitomicaceae bacterium]|jgi:hypothetical protein
MEGIHAELFLTFFRLKAIHKKRNLNTCVAIVGNLAMHVPTMLGSLSGIESSFDQLSVFSIEFMPNKENK